MKDDPTSNPGRPGFMSGYASLVGTSVYANVTVTV
jgi:hypothetical protein